MCSKTIAKVACFIVVTLCAPHIHAFPSEPDGFRGITWGTKRQKVPGLQFAYADSRDKRVKTYKRSGEGVLFDGVKMNQIDYVFAEGLFFRAHLITSGKSNYKKLRKAMVKRYGKWNDYATFKHTPTGEDQPLKTHYYYWVGDTTYIALGFTPTPANSLSMYDTITLSLCSQKIAKVCVYRKELKK